MKKNIKVEIIKEYMQKHHLSKTAFAKQCKISYGTLSKILNDDIHIRISGLFKVAWGMNVHICTLVY